MAGAGDASSRQCSSQLLVDISRIAAGDARTGIQRVVRAILHQLLVNPPLGYEITPIRASRWQPYSYAAARCEELFGLHCRSRKTGRVQTNAGDIFLGLDLAPNILPRHSSQIRKWQEQGAKICFVVHDLLPIRRPEWFTVKGARDFRAWANCLADCADVAICTSRTGAQEVAEWLAAHGKSSRAPIPVKWFYLAGNIEATVPSTGITKEGQHALERMRDQPTVLMVGTLEPRKGYDKALSAFEILWRRGCAVNLAIVGRIGWRVEPLVRRLRRHSERGRRLHWIENASDEALGALYSASIGVLMTSEAEGFGLPIVEAATHRKPVLANEVPVFREIAGDWAQFFSASSPDDLADQISEWIRLIERGSVCWGKHNALPTWADSARSLAELVVEQRLELLSTAQMRHFDSENRPD
jgi:glycosyltransferase involved in cell wall biosynthesis